MEKREISKGIEKRPYFSPAAIVPVSNQDGRDERAGRTISFSDLWRC